MTRNEFLGKLKEALENDLNGRIVQENMEYYNSYITGEVSKGRSEEEVTAELGDPWMIARSIIDMAESAQGGQDGYEQQEEPRRQSSSQRYEQSYQTGNNAPHIHMLGLDTWWKKLLLVLGIAGVVLIVVAVIGGIVSLLMPIIVPLLFVMLAIRLLGGRRR